MSIDIVPLVKTGPRTYRRWPQKEQILLEAAQTSVYGTALRYGLKPSQVFEWRKRSRAFSDFNNSTEMTCPSESRSGINLGAILVS